MAGPDVIVFDVNETLSNLEPLERRFADLGAPAGTSQLWFASVLRDGFALTAAGSCERFSVVAAGALRSVLAEAAVSTDAEGAVDHVLAGFLDLPVHDDVTGAVAALATSARLVTLSNGSVDVGERLLTAAGLRQHFEQILSVDDAGAWKPAAAPYAYAARMCATAPDQMLMVAVHPWDLNGAKRAGMRTAWVNRHVAPFPSYFRPPDYEVARLTDLPAALS